MDQGSDQKPPATAPAASLPATTLSEVRVDTWLWAVRQTKSRSQATAAVRAGHVRVNGEPVKASQKVKIGDEVRFRVLGFDRILQVTGILNKRVGAAVAAQAYVDYSPPRPHVWGSVAQREKGTGRPSKKERRQLDTLRGRDSHQHY